MPECHHNLQRLGFLDPTIIEMPSDVLIATALATAQFNGYTVSHWPCYPNRYFQILGNRKGRFPFPIRYHYFVHGYYKPAQRRYSAGRGGYQGVGIKKQPRSMISIANLPIRSYVEADWLQISGETFS